MIDGARWQTEYDVIVAGAGPAGIRAAIAAGRTGARTLPAERFPSPGGEAATALNLHLHCIPDKKALDSVDDTGTKNVR